MSERVNDGGLTFAVLSVLDRFGQMRSSRFRGLDHCRDVFDLQHDLVRAFRLRRSSSRPDFGDHQLGRWCVR